MPYETERALALLYSIVIASSIICCITSAILWSHWRYVLNACPETNCGCYLNARSTYTSFEGGHIAYCHYATFGLIIPLIFSIGYGTYHCYRVCLGRTGKPKATTATIRQRTGDVVVVTTETEVSRNDVSPYYWLPTSVIAGIMALYTLIYASIYTNGFEMTCKQYRERLLKEIQGVGNIVPVIKGRLSCASIFDFMDFLVESISFERRRYGRINSNVCYYMCLICAWVAVISWFIVTILNIIQTRRTKAARV